jgi:uncharacterized protein YkwD
MKKVIFLILFVVLATLGGVGYYLYSRPEPVVESAIVEPEPVKDCSVTDVGVVAAVNKFRAEAGIKPLVFNTTLDDFANQRALEQNGVLDNHAGLQPLLDKVRMNLYTQVGEDQNLIFDCYNSEYRVSNFRNSPKHWASLLNPRYDEVGVGFYMNVLVIDLGDLR